MLAARRAALRSGKYGLVERMSPSGSPLPRSSRRLGRADDGGRAGGACSVATGRLMIRPAVTLSSLSGYTSTSRSRRAKPDLGPERPEEPIDKRLGEVECDLAWPVRIEPLAVVVKAFDSLESSLFQNPLELAGRVAKLRCAPLLDSAAALVAVLPIRLGKQQASSRTKRKVRRARDQGRIRRVMERVIDQASVEPPAQIERFHVADLERRLRALAGSDLPSDVDHPRRDVVTDSGNPVPSCQPGHPPRAAPELAKRHPGPKVEELQDVAKVDEKASC